MKAAAIRVTVEGGEVVTVYVTGPQKETVAKLLGRYLKAEEGDDAEVVQSEVEIEVR